MNKTTKHSNWLYLGQRSRTQTLANLSLVSRYISLTIALITHKGRAILRIDTVRVAVFVAGGAYKSCPLTRSITAALKDIRVIFYGSSVESGVVGFNMFKRPYF